MKEKTKMSNKFTDQQIFFLVQKTNKRMKIQKFALLIFFILFIAGTTIAQDVDQRDQFKLTTIEKVSLSIEKGKSDSLELKISRARRFSGTAKVTLIGTLQKGVFVKIDPVQGKDDHYMLSVIVDASFSKSEFTIVPSCTINIKSKGIAIQVIVNDNINSKSHANQ